MERKENGQARQNNNCLAIKQIQGLYFLLKGCRSYSKPYPVSCSADTETPTMWKKLTICFQNHIDPRPIGIRRLMMSAPTKQSEECPWVDEAPLWLPSLILSLKTFPWKPVGSSDLLNMNQSAPLGPCAWHPAINAALSFTTTQCQ